MSLLSMFRQGLAKTSKKLRGKIQNIFQAGYIDGHILDELEEVLIQADVGVAASQEMLQALKEANRELEVKTEDELVDVMVRCVEDIFLQTAEPMRVASSGLTVYLMVGVNGSGKTTTIGKLAKRWKDDGKAVILAAADTFRAAAKEQLEVWADRLGIDMISHQSGSDPGAVVYDAVRAAVARKADLLVVDTAGRLHTKKNLMEELKKIKRIVAREIPDAPHEVILVVDGTTGQNGLSQARVFSEAVGVTGICITKLDGSAKGGIALAITKELGIPVKLVGMGEGFDDLSDFDAQAFAKGLFGKS